MTAAMEPTQHNARVQDPDRHGAEHSGPLTAAHADTPPSTHFPRGRVTPW